MIGKTLSNAVLLDFSATALFRNWKEKMNCGLTPLIRLVHTVTLGYLITLRVLVE